MNKTLGRRVAARCSARWAAAALACAALALPAAAEPISVLFVGNSYTFGRADPVMSYNAANVRDLTQAMWETNPAGSNLFEPHPWSGVAGIFKQFTVQAGMDVDVALSTRNAASLRGHYINSNAAGWDLRSNLAGQSWSQVVLQEQSDEPLPKQPGLASNPDWFRLYVDRIEDYLHQGTGGTYRERDMFPGATAAERTAACQAATGASAGTCNTQRTVPTNANASAATQVFLYQTWARPNLMAGAFVSSTDPVTGVVTRSNTPAATFYTDLEGMTDDLRSAYLAAANFAAEDGSGGVAGIAPVGEAFLRAVQQGLATRHFYADDALTDGLLDLWFDDGTHASTAGSYLSALTLFGTLTGRDPLSLGAGEIAARDLGLRADDALALQRVASEQLGFNGTVPEPGTLVLTLAALLALGGRAVSPPAKAR